MLPLTQDLLEQVRRHSHCCWRSHFNCAISVILALNKKTMTRL